MSTDLAAREVPCASIRVGDRHRKDMGDIDGLAQSIAEEGLLQPICITEDNVLVCGERRLRAVRDVLKHNGIAARVVHVTSLLAGEYAENELRKNFTPTERVAIADAVRQAMPERRGRPNENVQNSAHFSHTTRDIAAERAGLGNHTTYSEARKVIDHGAPELVAAMDSREVSIHGASLVARLPKARQSEIVALPPVERKTAIRDLRAELREKASTTGAGITAPTTVSALTLAPTAADCEPSKRTRLNLQCAATKTRMVSVLSQVKGFCENLDNLNVEHVAAVSNRVELNQWAAIARDAAKELRLFSSRLIANQETAQ